MNDDSNLDNIEKVDLDRVDWKSSREFFESIKDELDKLDNRDEAYNFTWVGKRKSIIEAGSPIDKTLRPDIEASEDFDNTKNMLIVGDNLDALKLLQESYLGQVKMIYIDPPYNTGHDFVYHDNFKVSKADYADDTLNDDGEKVVDEDEYDENSKANGRFHSDWLSMIYPRLRLARNLLSDDGAIFISIDDNEQANLKKVCDEIFGEENFLAQVVWERAYAPINLKKHFSTSHDYILCYARNIDQAVCNGISRSEETNNRYSNPDNDPRGVWQSDNLSVGPAIAANIYPIATPSGRVVTPPAGRSWRLSKEVFTERVRDNRIWFGEDGNGVPRIKRFLSELHKNGVTPMTVWKYTEVDHSQGATEKLAELFDGKKYFDYPKPVDLIKRCLELYTDRDCIVLDFFAGSGTTGHAVMDLNAEDGGDRRYILVQINEKTAENSEARKAGYESIDQITAERLRRAGDKIQSEHPEAKIDTGFRVFRIDSGNENPNTRMPLGEIEQSSVLNMIDNIRHDRTPLDLLFGVIYVSAMPFDRKLESRKIGDNIVYLYGYSGGGTGLVACLDDDISEEIILEIARLKSLTAAFKDSSFSNSAAKINLSEHFRVISPDTRVKVL